MTGFSLAKGAVGFVGLILCPVTMSMVHLLVSCRIVNDFPSFDIVSVSDRLGESGLSCSDCLFEDISLMIFDLSFVVTGDVPLDIC